MVLACSQSALVANLPQTAIILYLGSDRNRRPGDWGPGDRETGRPGDWMLCPDCLADGLIEFENLRGDSIPSATEFPRS